MNCFWRFLISNSMLSVSLSALIVAGCQASVSLPLLSPIETARDYGYAEKSLGGERYAVTYTGPPRVMMSLPASDADTQAALKQAYDFATWHAAQIAASTGYEGFRITKREAGIESHPGVRDGEAPLCGPFGPPVQPAGWRKLGGFGAGYPYAFARCNPIGATSWLQAHANIEIELLHAPGAADYQTDATLHRLQDTYPGTDRLPGSG